MGLVPSAAGAQSCTPKGQRAQSRELAALHSSSTPPAGVPAAAVAKGAVSHAGAGHTFPFHYDGDGIGPGSSSSSRSATAARARAAADAAVAFAPTAAPSVPRLAPVIVETGVGSVWGRYGFPKEFPKGVGDLCAGYLPDGEYINFQRDGVVPKRESGMLILARNVAFSSLDRDLYIPPTADRPSFRMPSNRRTFPFKTPDTTVHAILQLLSPSIPWNITMIYIVVDGRSIAKDLANVVAMLPAIATALEHVKYLVFSFNGLQVVFNVGEYAGESSFAQIGRNNAARIGNIINSWLLFPGGSAIEFCQYLLGIFPEHESLSGVLESIVIGLGLTDERGLTDCKRLTSCPAKQFDSRLRIIATMDTNFMLDPENAKLFPYFSNVIIYGNADDGVPVLLDFSNFDRTASMVIYSRDNSVFGPITLPSNKHNLEKILLFHGKYTSALHFPDSEPYLRLREIRIETLPLGSNTRLDSTTFPALESFSCESAHVGATLDLSGIKNPGLNLRLLGYEGTLILPTVVLGRLSINRASLNCATIAAALPTVHDLDLWLKYHTEFRTFSEMFQKTIAITGAKAASVAVAGAGNHAAAGVGPFVPTETGASARTDSELSLTSPVLEKLKFRISQVMHSYPNCPMGKFVHLQSLELGDTISAVLDGSNFPMLNSLKSNGGSKTRVIGIFPCLTTLWLYGVSRDMHVSCTAPVLHQLACITVIDATNIFIGPAVFPILQTILIRPIYQITPERPTHPPLPTFAPLPAGHPWASDITVRLSEKESHLTHSRSTTMADLIRRDLPGCVLIEDDFD